MEKNLTYFSMIVFVILFTVVWSIIAGLFYFLGKVSLNDPFSKKTIAFMVLHLTVMMFFLLCVFYSPWNRALTKSGDDAKKKHDIATKSTEAVHEVPEIETFLNETFSFVLLVISVFYTGLVLLVYTICHEKVYMVLPFLLFGFFGGMLYFQRPIPFFTTIGALALCIIESVMVFRKIGVGWCLIPLAPFYLTLFILYTQQ